jgi:hypothetical protein
VDTWQRSGDRMQRVQRPISLSGTFGHPIFSAVRSPMALFMGALYLSPMASSSSLSWLFCVGIATLWAQPKPSHSSPSLIHYLCEIGRESKCIAWVFASRGTWCLCFAVTFACYSWWLPPPRWLEAMRIIEWRLVDIASYIFYLRICASLNPNS